MGRRAFAALRVGAGTVGRRIQKPEWSHGNGAEPCGYAGRMRRLSSSSAALSLAAILLGKLGSWVLLMGLMRYVFIAAAEVLPALKGQLPTSFRRKLVCVLQIAVLCAILLPIVSPAIAVVMAVPALAALIYSFAVDSLYLLHHAKQADGRR